MLHGYRPSVVVFKESTKGRLGVYCVQLQCVGSDRQWVMRDADALEPNDRIDRRETSDGNRRVEEKLGVEFQHVALVYHRSAIDLECDIECLEDANIQKRIGRRAVGVVRAEFDPEGQHERLASVERHVNMTGRAVARSVREGHEDDMRGNDGIAVSINWNGEYAEEPALINLIPPSEGFPKCMRVSGHSCKHLCCQAQAKQRGRQAQFDKFRNSSFHDFFFVGC